MKKYNIILCMLMLILGFGIHCAAVSSVPSNIAVIDINKVLSQSSQVMALKKEQKRKTEELQKWVTTAKADIDKQQTKEGKEKLIKKYDSEYTKRQQTMQKEYTSQLQKIDTDISAVIAKEAKSKGYDIVLSKSVVLYGGTDLTGSIAKLIK